MESPIQFGIVLVASAFMAMMISASFCACDLKAANNHSYKQVPLHKNVSKNLKDVPSDANGINTSNDTNQNEMSIQICDKSHPCKPGPSQGNLQ